MNGTSLILKKNENYSKVGLLFPAEFQLIRCFHLEIARLLKCITSITCHSVDYLNVQILIMERTQCQHQADRLPFFSACLAKSRMLLHLETGSVHSVIVENLSF
jgi:hypothetical protein